MQTDKLNYELPSELIAQQPTDIRSRSRMLVLDRPKGDVIDTKFEQITDFLRPGDCLVLNDTKVIAARFFAQRLTGAKLEGLFLSVNDTGNWLIYLKGSGKVKLAESIIIRDKFGKNFCRAEIIEKNDHGKCQLKLDSPESSEDILDKIGFAPLPPYIKRSDDPAQAAIDQKRYQTVYAKQYGAVAAPTAGLHFTQELIDELKDKGVNFAYVTLHVGAGTFRPITTDSVEDHQIHEERFSIDKQNAEIINQTKRQGGRVIAVGTTSVRTLETIAKDSELKAAEGTTELFILPGYKFKIVDAMITNFHLPRSTLIALVGAFAGLDNVLDAYKHAVKERYRFYSYGDAMLII